MHAYKFTHIHAYTHTHTPTHTHSLSLSHTHFPPHAQGFKPGFRMVIMIVSLGTPPPPNITQSSETPRSADTRVYRAGRYRPETHRYRRKG